MHDMTKTRMMCVAAILAGVVLGAVVPAHGAQGKNAKTLTMEYLDPFDLSVTTYRIHTKAEGAARSSLPVAGGTSPIVSGSAVTVAEPLLPVSESPMTDVARSSVDTAIIDVVTVNDVVSLSDGLVELTAAAATSVTRVRVMVRIPFMPVLRSPCAPLV